MIHRKLTKFNEFNGPMFYTYAPYVYQKYMASVLEGKSKFTATQKRIMHINVNLFHRA